MKYIKLNKGKRTTVDNDMYEILSKVKWHAKYGGNFYAARTIHSDGNSDIKDRTDYMHWHVIGKPINGFVVDHINGNSLDNRRKNLRVVSHRENMANRLCHRQGKLPGVTWLMKTKKWQASLRINGKDKYLGLFKTREEAHAVYKKEIVLSEKSK